MALVFRRRNGARSPEMVHISEHISGRASVLESGEMDREDVATMRNAERRRNSRFGSCGDGWML